MKLIATGTIDYVVVGHRGIGAIYRLTNGMVYRQCHRAAQRMEPGSPVRIWSRGAQLLIQFEEQGGLISVEQVVCAPSRLMA